METNSQNNDLSVDLRSDALAGVNITLCVGGGIAAIEAPKVARELRRLSARVKIFATEAATKFVGQDALEWASSNEVTIEATGLAEHVSTSDAVLVFPATADLIGKAAHGICPDSCSTYIQSALGREQIVVFLPTMHESMAQSPAVKMNLEFLKKFRGVSLMEPRREEGKWKSPSPETIALEMAHRINQHKLREKTLLSPKVLVTLGGTASKIDVARTITNLSTGTLGAKIVKRLIENGVEVTALCANHSAVLPNCSALEIIPSVEFNEMQSQLQNESNKQKFIGFFHLAAISDFAPEHQTHQKISSTEKELVLKLKKLPKLIAMESLSQIEFKMACKFTASNQESEMAQAISLMDLYNLNCILWNWGENSFGQNENQDAFVINADKSKIHCKDKDETAHLLVAGFLNYLRRRNRVG